MRTLSRFTAGALAALTLTAVGCGQTPASRSGAAGHLHEVEGLRVDALGMLRELHARMVAETLALREARVVAAVVQDRDLTLTISQGRSVWSPSVVAAVAATPVVYQVRAVPQFEAEYWRTATLPADALTVTSGSELLAVAPTTGAQGEIGQVDVATSGPLFLAFAANELAETDYVPVPAVIDHCGDASGEQVGDTARAALMDYFGQLGSVPELQVLNEESDLRRQAEELAARATRTVDEVSGEVVGVSPNDLLEQLVHGVQPEDLRYEPTVPVTIDMKGIAPSKPQQPASSVVVLVDTERRTVLGWLPAIATWSDDGNGPLLRDYLVTAEVRRPAPTSSVGVLVRELGDERFDCAPEEQAVAWRLTVPYDDFAGSRRTTILLESNRYTATGRA